MNIGGAFLLVKGWSVLSINQYRNTYILLGDIKDQGGVGGDLPTDLILLRSMKKI